MKKLLITILILCLPGCGVEPNLGTDISLDNQLVFELKDRTVKLDYTDDNTDEDFIILTDKKEYHGGITGTEVYFAVINNGDETNADVNFYFESNEKVEWVKKYNKNVTVEDVPQYETEEYECDAYRDEAMFATSTTCYNEVFTGTSTVTKIKDEWNEVYGSELLGAKENKVYKLKDESKKKETGKAKLKDKIRLNLKGNSKKLGGAETSYDLYKAYISHDRNIEDSEFYIEVISEDGRYGHLDPWLNSSWTYRMKITIDNTKVDADLTDFPVLLDLSELGSDFHDNVDSAGDDIRITKSDGDTEVPFEIVSIDTTAETGELHFKADGTLSGSSDTDYYIYYGNSGASAYAVDATYGAENVWDANFKGVWHLSESSGVRYDSTSNDNDLSDNNTVTTETGPFGGTAASFNGSNEFLSITDANQTGLDGMNDITISAWWKPDVTGLHEVVSKYATQRSYQFFHSNKDPIGTFAFDVFDSSANLSRSIGPDNNTINTWNYLSHAYDNGTGFDNRANDEANTGDDTDASSVYNSNADFNIGRRADAFGYTDGGIAEVRVSNVARSADWMTTEYNNQNSPSTFYTIGSQETDGASDTCTYGGTGDWNVLESDNCYITTSVYVNGEFNLIGSVGNGFGCASGVKVSAEAFNFGTEDTSFDIKCFAHH